MSTLFGKPRSSVIKHPGILKRRAEANGRSTAEEAEVDSHSSDPTKRREGVMAKTFAKMRVGK